MALLLKYGSDINAVNGCGVSALWLVAARGDLKGAQTLLRAGAGFEAFGPELVQNLRLCR